MGAGLQTAKDYRALAIGGEYPKFMKLIDGLEEAEARAKRLRAFFGLYEEKDVTAKKKAVKRYGGEIQYDKAVYDTPDDDGMSPLHHACEGGHLEIVKALCTKGAGKDRVDKWGRTPLFYAAAQKRVEVVKFLASVGADLNLGRVNTSGHSYMGQDETWGDTPLHRAAEKGHLDVVQVLVGAGADKDRVGMGA